MPARKVEKKANVKHFTLEQAQAFLAYLDVPYKVYHGGRQKNNGEPSAQHEDIKNVPLQYKVFFYMALFGGFRRGELIALTWDDIDFNSKTISITKSSPAPKTFSSIRDVTLDYMALDTSATLLISQNIDVQTVFGRLGHSETSTTMNIYAHSLKKRDEVASDSLGELFKK